MALVLEEVRSQLRAVLDGTLDLEAFEDWLVAHSWNMHAVSGQGVVSVVGQVELWLAERSAGHLPDADFRRAIADLLESTALVDPESYSAYAGEVNALPPVIVSEPEETTVQVGPAAFATR